MFLAALSFFTGELIPPQERQAQLEEYMEEFQEEQYECIETAQFRLLLRQGEPYREDEEIKILLKRHIREGSTYVEYGARNGAYALEALPFLGLSGGLVFLESDPERFRELFWNLRINHVSNAALYCFSLDTGEKKLDDLNLSDVSLIRIEANGREDVILRGAEKTIQANRPVLILNMMGGIPLGFTDRFVKQEYEDRIEYLSQLGYNTHCIRKNLYLAVPK